jgi:hypothetical protein
MQAFFLKKNKGKVTTSSFISIMQTLASKHQNQNLA